LPVGPVFLCLEIKAIELVFLDFGYRLSAVYSLFLLISKGVLDIAADKYPKLFAIKGLVSI